MTSKPDALRRLIDLPGVNDLEYRALLKRDFAEPEARAEYPEIDACVLALFGLTTDAAEASQRIINAIAQGDADAAAQAMSDHLNRASDLYRQAGL